MYELRIYRCEPDRFDQVLSGLRRNAETLFVRYGFRPRAFWQTTEPEESGQSVVYLLEWADEAQQRDGWAALKADPAWLAFVADTQARGPAIAMVTSLNMEVAPDMPVKHDGDGAVSASGLALPQ